MFSQERTHSTHLSRSCSGRREPDTVRRRSRFRSCNANSCPHPSQGLAKGRGSKARAPQHLLCLRLMTFPSMGRTQVSCPQTSAQQWEMRRQRCAA